MSQSEDDPSLVAIEILSLVRRCRAASPHIRAMAMESLHSRLAMSKASGSTMAADMYQKAINEVLHETRS